VGGSTAFYSNGIYLDDKTKHFVVHHNFVHDSNFFGFCIKEENAYFNNTTANVGTPFLIDKDFQKGVWTNTKFAKVENNLSDGTLLVRANSNCRAANSLKNHGPWKPSSQASRDDRQSASLPQIPKRREPRKRCQRLPGGSNLWSPAARPTPSPTTSASSV
jgi:hypothetical protein